MLATEMPELLTTILGWRMLKWLLRLSRFTTSGKEGGTREKLRSGLRAFTTAFFRGFYFIFFTCAMDC